jgi:hypothetical protein
MQHLLRWEDEFVSYEYASPFVKCTYRTYSVLLKILPCVSCQSRLRKAHHAYPTYLMLQYYMSTTKPNRLMLFTETVAVYCENHTEHRCTLWAECRVLVCQRAGTYSNHWDLSVKCDSKQKQRNVKWGKPMDVQIMHESFAKSEERTI